MNKYFKKSLNHNMKINIYNGYTPYQCQEREIKALTIINEIIKNKECNSCINYKDHFPQLLEVKKNKYIITTHQGIDLQMLKRTNKRIFVKNLNQQIINIYKILKESNISHLDINENGKNICITNDGILSLIDFDIVHFKNTDNQRTLNHKMINRICSFRYCNSLIDFYKLITKIVKNCKNIIIIPEEIKEEIEEETEPVQSKTGSKNQSIQIKFE